MKSTSLLFLLLQATLLLLLSTSSSTLAAGGRTRPTTRRQPQPQPQLDSAEDKLSTYIRALVEVIKKEEEEGKEETPTTQNQDHRDLTTIMKELSQVVKNNTEVMKKAMMEKEPKCDPPYFALKDECFYVNTNKRLTWNEARRFCRGLGGVLAEPQNVNGLRAKILELYPDNDHLFFWMGATEGGSEGEWRWASGEGVAEGDWAEGQPDGGNENCVVLSRDDYPPLHDSPCFTHTMFVCEQVSEGKEEGVPE